AVFVLGVLACAKRVEEEASLVALLLGLALSYEPLAFVAAAAALAPFARSFRPDARAIIAFIFGLAPLGLGLAMAQRDPSMALAVPFFSDSSAIATSPLAFAREELGLLFAVVAAIGAALALMVPSARRETISILGVVATGALSLYLHRG